MNVFKTVTLAHRYFKSQNTNIFRQVWHEIKTSAEHQDDIDTAGSLHGAVILQRQREIANIMATYEDSPQRDALLAFHHAGLESDRKFFSSMEGCSE